MFTAGNGMVLTNGETYSNGCLWANWMDSPDNWREVTESEMQEEGVTDENQS